MILSAVAALQTAFFRDCSEEVGLKLGNDAACWVDVDQDGWPDLCTGGALWRNVSGKRFAAMGEFGNCVAADYDNEGYPDLFSWSQMKLYHNEAGKSFAAASLPDPPSTVSRGACWGDFDGDGFVDLFVGGYEDWDKNVTYPNLLLHNEHGKGFRLAWSEVKYRARGVTACDFNEDGTLDIYVSDYRLQPNQLLLNDRGALHDAATDYGAIATSDGFGGGHSIGAAWGDFDSDGHFDLFAGNFAHRDSRGDQPKSRFLQNLGPKGGYKFKDLGPCGVFYQESYASPAAGDFDNDGNLDLYFTTVYGVASFGVKNFPVLYRNGGSFAFTDVTKESGLAEQPATYQAAWADFNHDGKLDLVTGGKLFANQGANGHWLEVRLRGDGKHVNRSAVGTQVRIKLDKQVLARQVESGTGEGNQNDLTLHFGLGGHSGKVDLEIVWPDGKKSAMRGVRVDRIVEARR